MLDRPAKPDIRLFSETESVRLTGLSAAGLRALARKGVVSPSVHGRARLYRVSDIVAARSARVRPPIDGSIVTDDLERDIISIRQRRADDIGRIGTNAHGRPVIAGTRVPVAALRDFHAAGYGIPEILAQYPSLEEADVIAALSWERAT
jgi:uncharacterized protein (DUF433 family)